VQLVEVAALALSFNPETIQIGPAPESLYFQHCVVSGRIHGSAIDAAVLRRGSEWAKVRGDGVLTVEIPFIFEAWPRKLVFAELRGVCNLGENGYEALLDGVPPNSTAIDLVINFHTSAVELRWLNRIHCVGAGRRDFQRSTLEATLYQQQIDETTF
jgi:Protein of unknown function (DUF3237)